MKTIDRGQLRLVRIIRREVKHAPTTDQRRRVLSFVLAVYEGDDGRIYHKGFRSYGTLVVPMSGTHAVLNGLAVQF